MRNMATMRIGNLKSLAKYEGTTLIMALLLIMISTLIIVFASNYSALQTKLSANIVRNEQAFEAAEAGLEFGLSYLDTNAATILSNPTGGYINAFSNSSVTNVVLSNQAQYSITYTNPIASNYSIIKISSTGTSDDGTASQTISQLIAVKSLLLNPPTRPLVTQGSVNLNDNATVTNLVNTSTIESGSTVSLSNNAQTVLSTGTKSTPGNLKSDITQNSSAIGSLSQNDFFSSFFGASPASVKTAATSYYSFGTNHDYSSAVRGATNSVIWIDQTNNTMATIQNNVTIGSPSNPVILIVNGKLTIQDNVTIYGFIFVIGSASTVGNNVTIRGAMASTNNLTLQNNFNLRYDQSILDKFSQQSNTSIYAKIPGSWRDF